VEVLGGRNTRPVAEAAAVADSAAVVVGGGRRRQGRDKVHHYRVSAGSADEVVAGLRVAEAFGFVGPEAVAPVLARCDRVLAITWTLTH
jgi:hypothetical protein